MKKEEMNYEKWLEQLKKTPPVLENPDALTEDIMRAVKAAPFRNRPVRRLNFAAWCSAIAATLLLGLWVAEAVAVDPILSSLQNNCEYGQNRNVSLPNRNPKKT